MKLRQILYATLSFLAVNIGVCPNVAAASTLQMTETSQEINGTDSDSGVAFRASLLPGDHVIVDLYIGTKRIHLEIDYTRHTNRLRAVSQADETPVALSVQDILAFQKLRDSHYSPPPTIHTSARLRDALGSLINLMADAPAGHVIDITSGLFGGSYTSICPQIGGPGEATYTLGTEYHHDDVTVGPVCYKDPALGRCGKGGGPDIGLFGIGFVQRFTQECLNHDQCCEASKERPPACGLGCAQAFDAAEPGYLDAPDCGNTGGDWFDSNGETYELSDANSKGDPKPFSGILNASSPFCPSEWNVTGTRTGTEIDFTALNPDGPSEFCAGSYQVTGTFSQFDRSSLPPTENNGCNTAVGKWSNSTGKSGNWSWLREGTLLSRANGGPRPTNK